jgi:nucleoside phosphorylase
MYVFGSINGHNIVIASFSEGAMGTTPATATATAMLQTFPEIRFGLMVGIGAGVPHVNSREKDVRLGDVVVSKPEGRCGGVVQYDFGKAFTSGFNVIGMLNPPPEILLKAIQRLRAEVANEHKELHACVGQVLERHPELVEEGYNGYSYGRPADDKDELFVDSYSHPSGDNCSGCDKTQLEPRNPRPWSGPRVFHGVIGSGNQVVKSALVRRGLGHATGADILCFEMEAAGLMNTFPCLVIRGISDYADSHKNDEWQNYAALAAAVYAKLLLESIQAGEVATAKSAAQIVGQGGFAVVGPRGEMRICIC